MKGCLGGRRRGSGASLGRDVQEDVSKKLTPNTTDVLGQEIARLEIRHSPAYSRSTRGLVGLKPVGSDGAEEKGSGQCMYCDEELSKTWTYVLVSYSCYNKLPHIGGLTPIEIYSFTVPETRSLKSKCCQDRVPSRGCRAEHSTLQLH